MNGRLSVSVRDLHVVYRVFEDARPGFKQLFARGRVTREHRQIHAVRGVSFDVAEGESGGLWLQVGTPKPHHSGHSRAEQWDTGQRSGTVGASSLVKPTKPGPRDRPRPVRGTETTHRRGCI